MVKKIIYLHRLRIRPKCLVGLTDCNLRTTVLGDHVSMPVGISPTAMQRMAHPDGEIANAKGTIYYIRNIYSMKLLWLYIYFAFAIKKIVFDF